MPASSRPGSPLLLSVETVIGAAFRLYGAKFKTYAKVAFWATLWLWLWLVPTIAVSAFFVTVKNYYALLGLLIPALTILLIYCVAKYQINLALIARLAFGELTNRPESIEEAQRFTEPRTWRLFQASLLLGLVYLGWVLAVYLILIVVAIGAVVALGGPQALSGTGLTPPNVGAILLLLLLAVVLIGLLLLLSSWLGARFFLYSVAIAVEPDLKPAQSIRRSWSLAKGNVWRIVLILVVMGLALLPIAGLEQAITLIIQQAIVGTLSRRQADDGSGLLLLAMLVSLALNFGVQVVIVPLWQVTRAIVYHTLSSPPSKQV